MRLIRPPRTAREEMGRFRKSNIKLPALKRSEFPRARERQTHLAFQERPLNNVAKSSGKLVQAAVHVRFTYLLVYLEIRVTSFIRNFLVQYNGRKTTWPERLTD